MRRTSTAATPAPAVRIRLGGELRELPAGSSVADAVALLGHAPDAVGTAVNGAFVPRAARESTVLVEGDQVLVFQPVAAG